MDLKSVNRGGAVPDCGESTEREVFLQAETKTSERTVKAARLASAEAAAPDFLRRVAEEVRAAFPRPIRTPQLVLIDVDPRHLHAFWNLAADDIEEARREFGVEGEHAPMVLRIDQSDGDGDSTAFDVEVVGLQGRRYVEIWGEPRGYSGTLGLRGADGTLRLLAGPATVRLPNIGPPDQVPARPPTAAADTTISPTATVSTTTAPGSTAERHKPLSPPFPQPPSEAGAYDPLPTLNETRDGVRPETPDGLANAAVPAAATAVQGVPATLSHPPEMVRLSFPLPPTEPGEYVPQGLIGGFLPADAAPIAEERGGPAEAGEDGEPHVEAQGPHVSEGGEPTPDQPPGLPLENVLTLSSYALGRETVEFEINAELHIFGRVRPGTRLQLFGRPVALRPDGSFSITRPLPNGALLLSSLLVEGDGETSN